MIVFGHAGSPAVRRGVGLIWDVVWVLRRWLRGVDLMSYAALDKAEWEVRRECSVAVVAGVGFEPTTFRL